MAAAAAAAAAAALKEEAAKTVWLARDVHVEVNPDVEEIKEQRRK